MRVLLKMKNPRDKLNVLVNVREKRLRDMLVSLLEENRTRDAFLFLRSKAEVEAFLPIGRKPPVLPVFTLVEDELR